MSYRYDHKSDLLKILCTIICVVLFSVLGLYFAGISTAILIIFILPLSWISYNYPKIGLLFLLTYLHFHGTVAYSFGEIFEKLDGYIVHTYDYVLFQLAKDFFYIPVLFALVFTTKTLQEILPRIKPISLWLLMFIGCCLGVFLFINIPSQLSNPNSNHLLIGLIGLKVWLSYIPLILCGFYFLQRFDDLLLLNRLLIVVIFVCCCLCLIQYGLLSNDICSGNTVLADPARFKASLQAKCFFGGSLLYNPELGLIRLPGTFASPWHWAWFLIASIFIAYGNSVCDPSRRWQIMSWLTIISIFSATIVSGQRTALLLVPLSFLCLLFVTRERKRWLSLKLLVMSLIIYSLVREFPLIREQIDNFIFRWNYSPPQEFVANQLNWLWRNYLTLLGNGVGTATNAASFFGKVQFIETFHVKLMFELGIVSSLVFLGLVTSICYYLFKIVRSLRSSSLRQLSICLWLFIVLISYNPFFYPLDIDPVAIYYWFFVGVIVKLPDLDEQLLHKERFNNPA